MSVYTSIEEPEMRSFLERYTLGTLLTYRGISEGIENTNYFVNTTKGQFVLTIFEQQDPNNLPYFLKLMAYMADAGLPVPQPIPDIQKNYLQELCNKPATLITRLSGQTISVPTAGQCRMVGSTLAMMHLATTDFNYKRTNQRDLAWCHDSSARVQKYLNNKDADLLAKELEHQTNHPFTDIPDGTIHADLFRDNVLFNRNQLTGLIDFYYACNDVLIYDIAITVNDWCIQPDGSFDPEKYNAFLTAYQKHRPLNDAEQAQWQNALRRAALRFWLSRLCDKHFPRPGHITHTKNPDFLSSILRQHIQQTPNLCQNF